MMSIIKTAIITITISIISGLLLDRFKNFAPRILCNIENGVPKEINNKKVYVYIITVSNLSKKIIHKLTLNIQNPQGNLQVADAKITKGLKFNSSIKNDIVDIDIPFLSKGDKFSVKVYVENQHGYCNKPIVVLRSPENFKQVDSEEKRESLTLFNKEKIQGSKKTNNNKVRQNKINKNKKVMIVIATIAVFMVVGVLAKSCLKWVSTNTKNPSVKTDVNKESNDEKRSSENKKSKDMDKKESTEEANENINKKGSTGKTTKDSDKKGSTKGTTSDTNKKATGGTDKDTGTKGFTKGATENPDKKESTGGTTENIDSKPSTGETNTNTKNTDADTSTGGTSGKTNENTSTDGVDGN